MRLKTVRNDCEGWKPWHIERICGDHRDWSLGLVYLGKVILKF